ncbi:MAG TPA: TonB-dependent receptor [Opitutaceae bacterium]|jgi:iron complex outermembrane receptor protein|nr:TonB-dependent receptor [Opitutaceae bacterium]HRE05868.1 TonB-dependent receptor [Opitutaceae bacterium]
MLNSPLRVLARRSRSASILAIALAGAVAHGQTPPPSEDTVRLSEFSVTASDDRGYVPSETMTGSRVATKIIDLPYTVNVLTSEFFEDFGLFEFTDNLVHVGSFTGLDIGGGFNLRGFGSTYQLRDGFFRLGRYGSSNIDRMEIIKGSNAAIYGRTSPGGMVNMISKQPKSKPSQKLSLNYGDYGTQRVTLESTGPLFQSRLGKTSYIVTASHYQRDFDQEYARNRNQEYYVALSHRFPDGSNFFISGEYFLQMRHAPNNAAPLVIDQKGTSTNTDDVAVGYAKNLAGYNPFGPNSELNRGYSGLTANYDKRLSDVWSVRASANYYGARRWDYNQNTGWGAININPPVATTPITSARGATPSKTLIVEDGGGFQGDLLAHYWTNNRKIEHRTLATIDYNDYHRWDPSRSYAAANNPDIVAWNAVRTVRLDSNFRPLADIPYFPKWFQAGQEVSTRIRKIRATVLGGLVRHQAALMNGRLLTFAGARYDSVNFRNRDFLTDIPGYARGDLVKRRITALKPNLGVNFKLTPNLRIFGNYSESYFVGQADAPATVAEASFKPETAEGYDYGFKGSLFEDRLSFTISGFYAIRNNVTVTDVEETPIGSGNFVTVQRRDGDQLVRGWEIDANWRISNELFAGCSYGEVNSIYTDFGTAFPLAVGRKVTGISPRNGSAYLKYSPAAGRFKGFSANLGVTHIGETPTEQPNAGDTYATGPGGVRTLTRTTFQWRLTVPSATLLNLGMRYSWKSSWANQTVGVNLSNILDRDYLRANRLLSERRAVYFTYTIGTPDKRR